MALKTWIKRFTSYEAGEPITKSLINALGSVIRNVGSRESDKELRKFVAQKVDYETTWNNTPGWQITPEQTEQGLSWLHRSAVKKHLLPKDLSVIDNFDYFLFKGFEIVDQTRHASFPKFEVKPVYRVVSKGGFWFDYASAPWQAGTASPFEILSRGKL